MYNRISTQPWALLHTKPPRQQGSATAPDYAREPIRYEVEDNVLGLLARMINEYDGLVNLPRSSHFVEA
ncbi:uncharacterized protein N7518_006718 [Penicillium psychrosexuale]|uniref:uncharacterized protein n=1 Tax=Penicillium psychrosexuale TaxID=1002107 RepID=UPI002545748C|nr:uncharacterized protein N7518_006718 [Penicillium psychrosexuale]KAJ5789707.1 hypothetical protein N7518_006718 [Penicillium psychrosexuale]